MVITTSLLLLLLVAVTSSTSIHSQQHNITVFTNLSLNGVSCWFDGAELPCGNVVLALIAAEVNSASMASDHKVRGFYGGMDSEANDGECPTWMFYSKNTDSCVCGAEHHGVVKCNATLNETYILDCHQMTFDEKFERVIAGLSFHGCLNQDNPYDIYHRVPPNRSHINDIMCKRFKRGGRLCGACRDGYSPLVYSYQLYCKQCSERESKYNWTIFAVVAFIPLTFFYVFVILCKFNANSPPLNAFVLFAQMLTNPANIRIISSGYVFGPLLTFVTKLISTVYGIWNLDYFRTLYPDICLRLTTLQALSLDYVVAFYPLFLIVITYAVFKLHSRECRAVVWILKPIKKCLLIFKNTDKIESSMIDVFATFLLLSYNKVLSVSFDLLAFTSPVDASGRLVGKFLYYDASYEYFGSSHLPFGILAILIFMFFNVLPFLLLLLYPMKWFHKCLNHLKLSRLALHTFVDSFAGCYKDGTEPGTRDCRYFAALFLLLRILSYVVYQATLDASSYGWIGVLLALFTILFAIAKPYKSTYGKYNTVTITILGILLIVIIALMNNNIAFVKVHQAVKASATVAGVFIVLPQFYVIVIGIKWIYKHGIFRRLMGSIQPQNKTPCETSLLTASDYHSKSIQAQREA